VAEDAGMLMPTRSRLIGKAPEQIRVKSIRPTDELSQDTRTLVYQPILLVRATLGRYYIVDGNHRFSRRLFRRDYQETIPAWVLKEGDQRQVRGNPLPEHVRDWKYGNITLAQLTSLAESAYGVIAREALQTLQDCDVLSAEEARSEWERLNGGRGNGEQREKHFGMLDQLLEYMACTYPGLRRNLLERMRGLAQEGGTSLDHVLNDLLVRGLESLDAEGLRWQREKEPASPGSFTRAELNESRTWHDLYVWAMRERVLTPRQEEHVLSFGSALLNRTTISAQDRQRAEEAFDRAVRFGYAIPSDLRR